MTGVLNYPARRMPSKQREEERLRRDRKLGPFNTGTKASSPRISLAAMHVTKQANLQGLNAKSMRIRKARITLAKVHFGEGD